MARRVAELDYRVTGTDGAGARVRTLTQAVAEQTRQAHALVPALAAAQRGTGLLGAVNQASAQRSMAFAASLGPVGAGLVAIASAAPGATRGLVAYAAATERAGLLSRVSTAALLGGSAVMATGAVAAVGYASAILRGADAYTALNSRVRIFSDGAVSAAQNEQALYESAARSRQSVEGAATLFTRISPAVVDMGRAQADALRVTELTTKALAIQGATVQENIASTIQFSQGISSGVLRGDELKSMLESSPQLLRYIAANLEINGKVGVAFGQLRNLGEEGALTAERLVAALLRAQPDIERDFINAPKTAQQGWVVLKDTITRTIGQLGQTAGLQQGVFDFLAGISQRIDAFRKDTLLNPEALDPAAEAAQMLGDWLERAGDLAGGVVEHFDLIVGAAQALIALKVGEVLATGFMVAASKAREAYAAVQTFRANGPFLAGAALDQTGAAAAITARASATQAEARAIDLKAQAEVKARLATASRAAADVAATEASNLKAAGESRAALATEAEARASALATAADRAEAQAKAAATAATNAQAAASVRLSVAQEAEAAVTAQVTNAQALKAGVMRGLSGLYGLVGGSVGLLTIALGGLVYAAYENKRAWEEKIRTMHDAVIASDEVKAISDQLATATWAEIPALQAAARAHREKAAAALADAEATLAAFKARTGDGSRTTLGAFAGGLFGTAGRILTGQVGAAEWTARQRRDLEGEVAAGRHDRWFSDQNDARGDAVVRRRTADRAATQNRMGVNDAGDALTAAQRQANQSVISSYQSWAQAERRRLAGEVAGAEATARANPESRAHADVVSTLRARLDAVTEPAGPSGPRATSSSGSGGGRSRRSGASSEERAAQTLLDRVAEAAKISELMGRVAQTSSRFSIRDGKLFDGDGVFKARSEDEARAAAAYLEQMEAITDAKSEMVEKTGLTREALAAQAAQTLQTALATSQATQAQQRWEERMAEARGESTAVAQAEREVADARRQGADITDEAVGAYLRLIRAQEAARRTQEALNAARPVVEDVRREVLDDIGPPAQRWDAARGQMAFDHEAALRQWADARIRIEAEATARIEAETDRQVAAGEISATQAADRVAAVKTAVETVSAEQVKDLWARMREEDYQAWQDRLQERLDQERELADAITGSLEDLAMGGDASDLGRQFGNTLLRSIWEELVSNPLNLAIKSILRSMVGGDGGLWGSVMGALTGAAVSGGATGAGGELDGLFADGGLPGYKGGGRPSLADLILPPGLIRGPGGPRDDRILARVSNREFISNAAATASNLPLLQALNSGMSLREALARGVPAFAGGGLPGYDSLSSILAREAMNGDMGYSYDSRAADAERDIRMAEARSASPAALTVNVINQTSQPVRAETRQTADGLDVTLFDAAVQSSVKKMGASGSLMKSLGATPTKKRR